MKALKIRKRPDSFTVGKTECPETYIMEDPYRIYHESLLRSFQIVQKVKELLQMDTPAPVVLEMIEIMEGGE